MCQNCLMRHALQAAGTKFNCEIKNMIIFFCLLISASEQEVLKVNCCARSMSRVGMKSTIAFSRLLLLQPWASGLKNLLGSIEMTCR